MGQSVQIWDGSVYHLWSECLALGGRQLAALTFSHLVSRLAVQQAKIKDRL